MCLFFLRRTCHAPSVPTSEKSSIEPLWRDVSNRVYPSWVRVFLLLFYFTFSVFVDYVSANKGGRSGRVVKRAAILPSRACVFCVRVAVIFFKRVLCVCMMCTYMCFCSPPDKAGLSPLNFCTSGGGRPLSTLCRKYSKTAGAQCPSVVFLHDVKCTPKKYGWARSVSAS